jgi:predicted GIY-YIG superfamily endonuclease
MVSYWCYVLKLQDSCFYVGISRAARIEKRIDQHFRGDGGSKWCHLHHPLEVLSKKRFPDHATAFAEEQRLTILYMRTYGIRFVRGADALNTRADCYTPGSIQFWVPKPLRKAALRGELGEVDPQPIFSF